MRSAIRWAGNKVLDILFGAREEIPDYPPTALGHGQPRRSRVECPCGCGMTMGEIKELGF